MTPAAIAPKLQLRGLHKSFGGRKVLDGIDLEVPTGRSLVIIGGSGQGKSVLIKIAAGLLQPDAGAVFIDGRDVTSLNRNEQRARARQFGFLFQGAALFDSLSVWRNVAFRLLNADRVREPDARATAIEALRRVGLGPETAELFPGDLSGGMQKRVGLARAVVAHPEIIFFDEPTTGLDPINAANINELIVEEVKRLGCTAISITHDLGSARLIGDEIAMLDQGQIIWRGPVSELDHSGDPKVAAFISAGASGLAVAAGSDA